MIYHRPCHPIHHAVPTSTGRRTIWNAPPEAHPEGRVCQTAGAADCGHLSLRVSAMQRARYLVRGGVLMDCPWLPRLNRRFAGLIAVIVLLSMSNAMAAQTPAPGQPLQIVASF